MIVLSKRLQCIADLIPPCEILADVGTDHGYLPVWLLQTGRIQHALASDIGEGPLQRAKETALKYDLTAQFETILADGLAYPDAQRAQVISICGMGGETMISILQAAPWTRKGRFLVLQPQSKVRELEIWLQENGYAVQDARLCLDADKLYLAMSVLGGEGWKLSAEDCLLRRKDPLLPEYVRRETEKAQYARSGLSRASADRSLEIQTLEQRLSTLRGYEKEMEAW